MAKLPSVATTRRPHVLELPVEIGLARCDLFRERIAVPGRTALEDGRSVDVCERDPHVSEEPLEELTRAPGERRALAILVEPG